MAGRIVCVIAVALIACSARQDAQVVPIGDVVPDVRLPVVGGEEVRLADYRADAETGREGRPLVIVSWSYRCPTGRQYQDEFRRIARWCGENDVAFLAVCWYGDTEEEIAQVRQRIGFEYPVALDPERRLRNLLGVRTATHTFVLDAEGRLRYRGAIDNSNRPREERVCYATAVAQALKEGREVEHAETRPFG